jgi:cell division protein FtsX
METVAVVVLLSMAMVLPAGVAAAGLSARVGAEAWLASYRPVVYLARQTGSEATGQLVEELEGWTLISQVVHRTPAQAMSDLEQRLGKDELARLGIKESMLPHSLIIEPALPVVGHVELASRLAGLEARMEITNVDIPSPLALRTLSSVKWLLLTALAMILLFVLTAAYLTAAHLRALQRRERQEWLVLELLGATRAEMRQPTMIRALTIGLAAGGLGMVLHGTGLGILQHHGPQLIGGVKAFSATVWMTTLVPLIGAPLLGLLAGWIARPTADGPPPSKHSGLIDVLTWRRHED